MGAALTTSGRLRLLEAALEAGITHFDTAPLYGQGLAESLLGRLARSRRDTLTITTKFGLLPRKRPAIVRPLIPIARVINRRLLIPLRHRSACLTKQPGLRSSLPGLVPRANGGAAAESLACPAIPYTPAMLKSNLEQSLRNLGTDYIDYYLLHECHADYLNFAFLDCLESLVKEGKIRHYGIGSGRRQCRRILETHPTIPWVVQIPDGWTDRDTEWFHERGKSPLFTHSSLRLSKENGVQPLHSISQRWATLTNQDPSCPTLVSEFLLTVAILKNASGCVIFSSRNANHIRNNIQALYHAADRRHAVEKILMEVMGSNSDSHS